ncbi:MAG: hypothetical protein IT206_01415 [Fimbriimonadaceae bacterium]|nr:hypothetical protein [Fimbriimonadaceae bacterium]
MALKVGDRVRVISREVTADDRKSNRYFDHMKGMVGVIESIYSKDEIAVKIDPESMVEPAVSVHAEATRRMRERFISQVSEEAKGLLTKEEVEFPANYVLLVRTEDLESAK